MNLRTQWTQISEILNCAYTKCTHITVVLDKTKTALFDYRECLEKLKYLKQSTEIMFKNLTYKIVHPFAV